MILATTKVEDFDRFLKVFSTHGGGLVSVCGLLSQTAKSHYSTHQ